MFACTSPEYLLVEFEWLQGNERDDCVAKGFAEGTQVLSILQVKDQLCMKAVPGGVLNCLKIPGNKDNTGFNMEETYREISYHSPIDTGRM